ncbi:MAG: M14 family zinc carboxypeptidase [Armatimonadota bacterium]
MMDRMLMRRLPPLISTPEFWPATFDRFDRILSSATHCQVEHIGTSAGGRAIHGVTYRGRTGAPTIGIVGGMHGHEPQGVATCLNVITVLGYGRDLKGTSWPQIVDDLNYVIVPVLNPDARARMPNSFVGLARQDILHYDAGMTLEGERHEPGDGDCDPKRMMILGGLFNDHGQHINRETDPESIRSPEIRALMQFMADHRPQIVLELHAHASLPMLIRPDAGLPEDIRQRQQGLCERILEQARAEGIPFNESLPTSDRLSTCLYHRFGRSVPLLYESPQGVLDSEAAWSHEHIIDTCMMVVSCLCAELMG